MDKSFVGMGFYACPICGSKHSESVLINRRLSNTLTKDMFLGWDICSQDKALFDQGYIALVGCNQKTNASTVKMEEANRTGELIHIKKEAFKNLFNEVSPTIDTDYFYFVDQEVINQLKQALPVEDNKPDTSETSL